MHLCSVIPSHVFDNDQQLALDVIIRRIHTRYPPGRRASPFRARVLQSHNGLTRNNYYLCVVTSWVASLDVFFTMVVGSCCRSSMRCWRWSQFSPRDAQFTSLSGTAQLQFKMQLDYDQMQKRGTQHKNKVDTMCLRRTVTFSVSSCHFDVLGSVFVGTRTNGLRQDSTSDVVCRYTFSFRRLRQRSSWNWHVDSYSLLHPSGNLSSCHSRSYWTKIPAWSTCRTYIYDSRHASNSSVQWCHQYQWSRGESSDHAPVPRHSKSCFRQRSATRAWCHNQTHPHTIPGRRASPFRARVLAIA